MSDRTLVAGLLIACVLTAGLAKTGWRLGDDPVESSDDPFSEIPLPASPVCPPGSDCHWVHPCGGGDDHEQVIFGYTTAWNTSGDNRIWASPRLTELTGDGTLDIVVGTGVEEAQKGSIMALDGANGSLLWEVEADQEIFASAQFHDLSGDGVDDIVVGGRMAQLFAIDGSSGETLWRFDVNAPERANWFQFYTGQFIDDIDGDGTVDWLTANGGDPTKSGGEARLPGMLVIISGADGSVIAAADTPDDMETYMSTLHYRPHPSVDPIILFGTGGETFPGRLWATSVDAIMDGYLTPEELSVLVEAETDKGMIAPPSVADLNLDGILDVVVPAFDGRVIAIDGRNHSEIWRVNTRLHAEGGTSSTETYASPALGFFTPDAVPDVFVHYSIGTFPMYRSSWSGVIDGATGELIWSEDGIHTAFASPLAVDFDADGHDEVLMTRGAGLFTSDEWHEVAIFDTCTAESVRLMNASGASLGTPTVADMDGDGDLELITVSHTSFPPRWDVKVFNLDAPAPTRISWGGYLGTHLDGRMVVTS